MQKIVLIMALTVSLILAGISVALLIIYGADVAVGGTTAGEGFLPLDAMTRGIGFGTPPIILSFVAYFISRKEPSKPLGGLIIAAGILVIIGGAVFIVGAGEAENIARMAGEGGSLIGIGAVLTALGAIKIKKS